MLEKSLVISCFTFAIWYTMLDGEIFGRLGRWLNTHLPERLKAPVFDCPVCMVPYHGTYLYWLIYHQSLKGYVLTIIVAMGLNVMITRLWPDR